jgi:small subunit ribosomal protein S6
LKRYEVVAIVKADLAEENINTIIDKASLIITERKGIIAKAEKWGKRRLAYEINKQKDGFYVFIDYAGDGSIVAEMERNFKIDDRILKFMTVTSQGSVTREGIDAEIAEAEAKRSQTQIEPQGADEKPAESLKLAEAAQKTAQPENNNTKGE